jgi:hypothetical protein
MIEKKTKVPNRTQYEVISRLGHISQVKFTSAQAAGAYARECWPLQEQDEDRTGKGWDVQVAGCDS